MKPNLYEEMARIDTKVSQFRDIIQIIAAVVAIVVLGHFSWS